MVWEFRLLGELAVLRDGVPISLTSGRSRVLLVSLLLQDNRSVSVDQLATALWPVRPPAAARNAIHTYVMRLRRGLGAGVVIRTRTAGYTLEVDPRSVDLNAFHESPAAARVAAQASDTAAEHAALTAALALWRGPVLSDIPPESVPEDLPRSLELRRLDTLERRALLDIEAERYHEAITDLSGVTRSYPLRENAWETLLVALHRAGRTAEALAAYLELRRTFRDQLGVAPNERLRRLHQVILGAERPEPATPLRIRPAQLPMAPRGFVGQATELARVSQQLATRTPPMVVLSGPPGVGKTAFAPRLAHRVRATYPDGQLYADLRGYAPD